MKMASCLNIEAPRRIRVYAVEVRENDVFGDAVSDEAQGASVKVADLVKRRLSLKLDKTTTSEGG